MPLLLDLLTSAASIVIPLSLAGIVYGVGLILLFVAEMMLEGPK